MSRTRVDTRGLPSLGDPRNVGRIVHRGSGFVGVHDDDLLGHWRKFNADEESLKLCRTRVGNTWVRQSG
jgi:hypothetical protein